jgi:hypothetical protein
VTGPHKSLCMSVSTLQIRYRCIHALSQDWKQGVQQHTTTYSMAPGTSPVLGELRSNHLSDNSFPALEHGKALVPSHVQLLRSHLPTQEGSDTTKSYQGKYACYQGNPSSWACKTCEQYVTVWRMPVSHSWCIATMPSDLTTQYDKAATVPEDTMSWWHAAHGCDMAQQWDRAFPRR